jgi:hypothetical protein
MKRILASVALLGAISVSAQQINPSQVNGTAIVENPGASQIITQPSGTTFGINQGTASAPGTALTFNNPTNGINLYDNSPQTSNAAAQGNPYYAPGLSITTNESGGATAVPLYTQTYCMYQSTGTCYASYVGATVMPGSRNFQLAWNPIIVDNGFFAITSCSTSAGLSTCNLLIPTFSAITNNFKVGDLVYISDSAHGMGVYDTSTGAGTPWTISAVGPTSVSFSGIPGTVSSTGTCDTSNPMACPHMALPKSVFSMEFEAVNNAQDPGDYVANPRIPQSHELFRGELVTTTLGQYPLSWAHAEDGFAYVGYEGFDALNTIFMAGNPTTEFAAGASFKLKAKSAFRSGAISADPNAGNAGDSNSNDSLSSNWDYYQAQGFQDVPHSWSVKAKVQGFNTEANWQIFHDTTQIAQFTPIGQFMPANGFISPSTIPRGNAIGWNSASRGETDIINNPGPAISPNQAGWYFIAENPTTHSRSTVATIDQSGNINATTVKPSNGFTGVKTTGTCTFTIVSGIITNVTGC